MSKWFRFYSDAIRNPKVAKLSDGDFRTWVQLLSIAAENDGAIPCADDLKHVLKTRLDHLSRALDRLIRAGLIDAIEGGYEPHNWSKFQYKSDTSTERVRRHREERNVSGTPPDTETEQNREPPNPQARRFANPNLILQSEVDAMSAQSFAAHCEQKGRRLSAQTAEAIVAVLRDVRAAGGSPAEALQLAIRKGWVSLELEYLRNAGFKFAAGTTDHLAKLASWPDEKWRSVLDEYRQTGEWRRETYGPRPGESGCLVPARLTVKAA